ncbi:MAG: HNH endonuclease [Chloroflexi bacterium]|nr:HNH endonuclease [Chloroflexota bacterium]
MPDQRTRVAERAKNCCEYCLSQEQYSSDSFSVEHIVPLIKGGKNTLDNLAFACQGCNNRKYTSTEAYDLVGQVTVLLFHPRLHKWEDHFSWSDDGVLILGLTPIGRATVDKLQLNRVGLINLRHILFDAGEHPPIL